MPGAFKQKRPNKRTTAHAGASPTAAEAKKLQALLKAAAKKKETKK